MLPQGHLIPCHAKGIPSHAAMRESHLMPPEGHAIPCCHLGIPSCELYLGGMELDDIAFDGMAWHWAALVIGARHSSMSPFSELVRIRRTSRGDNFTYQTGPSDVGPWDIL